MSKSSCEGIRTDSTRNEAYIEGAQGQPVEWIDRRERLPGEEDADKYGCILAFNVHVGMHMSNPENYIRYGGVCEPFWARTPREPDIDPEYLKEIRGR